jgi:hypothetical protein
MMKNSDIKMIAMGCNPDPYKFKIVKFDHLYDCTIIEAKYDGCKSFNGHKLMLLKGTYDPFELESLDPHFLDENYAVIARFIPNKLGWKMARSCIYEVYGDN